MKKKTPNLISIRPLNWTLGAGGFWRAGGMGYSYSVWKYNEGWVAKRDGHYIGGHGSEDEAKAAAQDDFNRLAITAVEQRQLTVSDIYQFIADDAKAIDDLLRMLSETELEKTVHHDFDNLPEMTP